MFNVVFVVLTVFNVICSVGTYYIFILTLGAVRRTHSAAPTHRRDCRTRFLFVIPAHDEESGIRTTIASCQAVDYDPGLSSVVVIADNCSDRTAEVARAAGATVVERDDRSRMGKGYALEYLLDRVIAPDTEWACDAVVVIDADSVVDPQILTALSGPLAEGKEWIQCYNTVSNPDASRRTKLLTYAFSLCNGVWLLGQEGLGLSVALRGNGMCFATRALKRRPWRAYGLTEDLEFSWMLRMAGERAYFIPEACVLSPMLARWGVDAAKQRRRWEWGRKELPVKFFVPLLRTAKLPVSRKACYAVELFFPPLVTLLLALLVAMSVHLVTVLDPRMITWSRRLFAIHGLMALVLSAYAFSPILLMGLPARYLACLLDLPRYAAWKTLALSKGRPPQWERTKRMPEVHGEWSPGTES
jgi:1,2-diacylglycerol 3-beta-glucosyltransferase